MDCVDRGRVGPIMQAIPGKDSRSLSAILKSNRSLFLSFFFFLLLVLASLASFCLPGQKPRCSLSREALKRTWFVVWSTTWAISMTGYLGIDVGTNGRYLIWMAGHDRIDSLEGSSGCVKKVRSECTEYTKERSPS